MSCVRLCLFVFLAVSTLTATTVSTSLPDYDGPANETGFPINIGVIGTFNYLLPAGAINTSAAFSGTYGTAVIPHSTAGFDAEIEGATFTVCAPLNPDCWMGGAEFRPFSIPLPGNTFAGLADGSADLSLIQTNEVNIRLGSPTLTIEYGAAGVPEPSTWMAVSGALAALLGMRRRRRSQTADE